MNKRVSVVALLVALLVTLPVLAAKAPAKAGKPERAPGAYDAESFSGLTFRSLGPAVFSGRISDVAIDPKHPATMFVAVASGNVWKTTNKGITWTPIFDKHGAYSIGCVTLDPNDSLVVWVGTGENKSQRSVGYGDGVYKSLDGGKTFENVGLKASEHIGKILVDPRDSNVVYVAAQGPLWSSGGDRGLYKTTDGGTSWTKVLDISENTGVSDIVFDPRNPDVVYATSYQRRRHVWTLVNGGPESAIHKSRDGGATWKKITKGLPEEHLGKIGLAISPARPNTVYALVEAANGESGFFRSTDAGGSWERRSKYNSQSPQYYQEIYADPKNADRVYSMDTFMHVTEDGGKTFKKVGERNKHVDNHVLWIDESDTDHLIAGCDGGLYETWDRGANWFYWANLPIMQFYDLAVDDAKPFYNVYGGTQDNATLGGPVRTISDHGIVNSDWFVTTFGDGFQIRIDPTNPDIVYSESQYGGLTRFDRKTGEVLDIKPMAAKGEEPLRFNWDSPLVLSPHSPTRLYFGAQRLFRSDDRGNSWTAISPDLTRRVDRNTLKVMGKIWPPDAVAKNASTSLYGNLVALDESPKQEGLVYTGSDDGMIQVTEDGGKNWRKNESFPGVPASTYVSRIVASSHDANTVYATFNNHKMGDFKPYVMRSRDRGKSWTSLSGDLPARGSVYAFAEDHVVPELLFVGTEFGVFFTRDGGSKWVQLKGGLPTIAVRDLAIQKRENDLVLGTFGRGFYVLDDYTPLRAATPALLESSAQLFGTDRTAWLFAPSTQLGIPGKAFQGENYYAAPNPPFGAVFTYYLKEEIKTLKKTRQASYEELEKKGGEIRYPSWDSLRAEGREHDPVAILTVTDEAGSVVRRITGPVEAGFHRIAWDLRYPASTPTELEPGELAPWGTGPRGPFAAPGTYNVSLATWVNGKLTSHGEPTAFKVESLGMATLPAADVPALVAFQRRTASLQRAVRGAEEAAAEAQTRLDHIKQALIDTPAADPKLFEEARAIEMRLKDLQILLSGDPTLAKYQEPVPISISDRVGTIVEGSWATTSTPTKTHMDAWQIASDEFAPVLEKLRALIDVDLRGLEQRMESLEAPWTPGRVPAWRP
ncbi:MAG: VPS10 domain-containing protein [Thermoanaerobaculia bacterium]